LTLLLACRLTFKETIASIAFAACLISIFNQIAKKLDEVI
jgi:predicted PurR-regulated permease PerM